MRKTGVKILLLILSIVGILVEIGCTSKKIVPTSIGDISQIETLLKEEALIKEENLVKEDYFLAYFNANKKGIFNPVWVENKVWINLLSVEKVAYLSLEEEDSKRIYELVVTGIYETLSKEVFNQIYYWDEAKKEYLNRPLIGITVDSVKDKIKGNTIYRVWVDKKGNTNFIKKVEVANKIPVNEAYVKRIENNQTRTVLPYYEVPTTLQMQVINEIFSGLEEEGIGNEKTENSPYKDNITQVEWDFTKLIVVGTQNNTYLSPEFKLNIPAKVVLSNKEVIYYEYYYLVHFKMNSIDKIRFLGIKQ